MATRLILIVPDGADSLLSILTEYLLEWVTAKKAAAALEKAKKASINNPNQKNAYGIASRSSSADCGQQTAITTPTTPLPSAVATTSTTTTMNASISRTGSKTFSEMLYHTLTGSATGCGVTAADVAAMKKHSSSNQQLHNDNDSEDGSTTRSLNDLQMHQHQFGRRVSASKRRPSIQAKRRSSLIIKQQQLERERQRLIEQKKLEAVCNVPFEVHAYEALLTTIKALESQEFNKVNGQVTIVLGYFKSGFLLPIEIQEQMRYLKNDLSNIARRIANAHVTLSDLTEDDEDMALMNLTCLKKKPTLY